MNTHRPPTLRFAACGVALSMMIAGAQAQSAGRGALQGFGEALQRLAAEEMEQERELELARKKAEIVAEREERLERQRQEAAQAKQEQERMRLEEEKRAARLYGVTGTGFFVTDTGYVITNNHVIADYSYLQVRLDDGRILEATRVATDPQRDLALLRVPSAPRMALPVSRGGLSNLKGEPIFVIGYPIPQLQGQESKITDGIINSLSGPANRSFWFQHSAPTQSGNSGGPITDKNGVVVGVAVAQINAARVYGDTGGLPQNVNYGIGADTLLEFLQAAGVSAAKSNDAKPIPLREVDRRTVMVLAKDAPPAQTRPGTPEQDKVERAHPGWRDLVKTAEFTEWFRKQPSAVAALAKSPRSEDAIRMLDLFIARNPR